jgi:D-alanyl-D-alanine dipeptidase
MPAAPLAARVLAASLLLAGGELRGAPTAPASMPGLVDAKVQIPLLRVELKYSTTDNFMRKNVYGSLTRCMLRPEAARQLAAADRALRAARPELRLLAYDCARPLRVQRLMWKLVAGTPAEPYVANPRTGSMHNYGCAIDLTLAGKDGKPLDMGTPYDHAGPRSQPRLELAQLRAGKLGAAQLANRLVLRLAMVQGGFIPLDLEWWHFDCASVADARKRFTKIQ